MKVFKAAISTIVFIFFLASAYSQVWKQYEDSAKAYANQKNTVKAIEFYYKTLEELKKDSTGTNSYAQICDSLGMFLYRMNQYKEAKKFYIEAKQVQEKVLGKQNAGYARSCYYLGILYLRLGQYDTAEALSLEAKQIREKVFGKEAPEYASSCNRLGLIYYYKGQYEKAEPLYIEAKQIQEKIFGRENPDYAGSCSNLSILYLAMGQYEKAIQLSLEVMQIREKILGKENLDYASSCNNVALIYVEMGLYDKAEPIYLEAMQIREKLLGKENHDYAQSCDNLARLYRLMGHYDKAEPLYIEAKQMREKVLGKETPDYAQSCDNLAELYRLMGQYNKSEALYLEAKQVQEKVVGKENPDYAQSCDNLALLYTEMGQYDKAEALYLEAKQMQKTILGKEHYDYAITCSNLGALYIKMGQYQKAEAISLEANQICEKVFGKENPYYANSCDNLGKLYKEMGQYEKAKPFYIEAKEIRQKELGKLHPDYGSLCDELATLYWAMNQPVLADNEFKESFSVNAYNLNTVFQFTNEKEKEAFVKNRSGEDDKAYSFYVSEKLNPEQPYSLSLFHRNLILSSSQDINKQLFYANDSTVINKYNNWLNLKKYLSVLYSKPVSERMEDPAKIEDSAGILEKELTRISAGFKKQQQKVDWKDIRSKLKPDEASIEFASFHFYDGKRYTDSIFYIASVIRKDVALPSVVFLFNEKQLTDLLSSISNKTTDDGINELYVLGGIVDSNNNPVTNKSIYELVWKPLEKVLQGIKTVYFAPAGTLHRVAFAALPINKNEVLSDRYKLIQLGTTASVIHSTPGFINPSDAFQLYGGIKYDADSASLKQSIQLSNSAKIIPEVLTRSGSFNYLPGTKTEIESIEKQAKNTQTHISVLSGINATEESFKALDGKASPAVLHIATHGFFFPDPKTDKVDSIQHKFETSGKVFKQSDNPLFRSGLAFAGANNAWKGKPIAGIEDGILTAYEVSNMYLPNTKLVVLSACETALGDIQGSEGVYGLQRAFKIAGVQNLVMSLWKVPDAETGELMSNFYQNLFAKQSISNAFYRAQTTMKNKYRNQPYKWAAWILVR